MEIQLRAYAKINLFLNVLEKRLDGYHEIESVFHAISLYDTLTFSTGKNFFVRFSDPSIDFENNTITVADRALRKYLKGTDVYYPKISVNVEKKIPVKSGLGGGSSNAAAYLLGVNQIFSLGLKKKELIEIATEVGSDVPFFLFGGACLVCGRGERVTPIISRLRAKIIIVTPRLRIETKSAYALWKKKDFAEPKNITSLIASLKAGDLKQTGNYLFNSFSSFIIPAYPELYAINERLKTTGLPFGLSGSGSSFFVLCSCNDEAEKVYKAVEGITDEIYETFPITVSENGEYICRSVLSS